MRRRLLTTSVAALTALVACVTADGEAISIAPAGDAGTVVPEASPPDEAEETDAEAPKGDASAAPECNDYGWCETKLPDPDLTLYDVWPFEGRAFAIAQSETLGTKLLEWTESTGKWVYVDDNSQNTYRSGHYTGKMFAPSENEVYFITAPGLVFHGTRPAPDSPFTWESSRLPNDGPVYPDRDPGVAWSEGILGIPRRFAYALGVFGTSKDEVYAWFGNRIFRRTSAGNWVSEFVAEDPDVDLGESFYIFNAAKGVGDEIWFVGGRGEYGATGYWGCPTLYLRTASGYSTVINGSTVNFECSALPGSIEPTWWFDDGWSLPEAIPSPVFGWGTAVLPVGPGQALLLIDGDYYYFYYVDVQADLARLNMFQSVIPPSFAAPVEYSGIRLGDRVWFSGQGIVFSSEIKKEAWEQSLGIGSPADYQGAPGVGALIDLSSIAIDGRYLDEPLYQLRASSANNLWVVGNHHAIRKKTP